MGEKHSDEMIRDAVVPIAVHVVLPVPRKGTWVRLLMFIENLQN
jgi:hypothetical protein